MTTKMLPITTITLLLLCQHLSITLSTRLPLEVYELTSATTSAAHDLRYLQQQQQLHKHLEYDTLSVDEAAELLEQQQQQQHQHHLPNVTQPAATLAVKSASETTSNEHSSSSQVSAASVQQQLDRRRSRQMLDLLQQKHQHQQQQQEQQQQQQQQQHHLHHQHQTRNFKDIRILYQVGETEEDLPICAPNAVCSKIDLYETPWIERQCRCPESNHHHQSHVILHHHNSNSNNNNHNNKDTSLDTNSYTHISSHNSNSDKYRSYYEQEKLLQHKRLLVSGDFVGDKRFESLHLKKLMQKLGAVYQDDLDLHPGDFLETNEDIAGIHPDEIDLEVLSENEFPHAPPPSPSRRKMHHQQHATTTTTLSSAHMRHSGHGNHAKEISYIGGCPSGLGIEDGHTIADKTRHYKMCSPVHKLPVCKHFRDYTWTLTTSAELNVTEQIVHCRCPKNSVTYLTKREPAMDGSGGFNYLFACSPLTRIRCQRKQPCKLFTVRKRQEFLDEVNINALCQCPKGHHCPSHHTQGGVIPGESFLEDNIQTYSGYCMVND